MRNVYIDGFLAHISGERGMSEHTVAAYRNDLHGFLRCIAPSSDTPDGDSNVEVDWNSVDTHTMEAYVAQLDSRGYSPSTRARKVASVRSFTRFLKQEGVIDESPTRKIRNPKAGRKLPKSLATDEVEALLAAANRGSEPTQLRDRAMVELMYAGGLRVSETTGLDIDHVSFDNLTVRCTGKGGKDRVVPIYEEAIDAVAEYLVIGRPEIGKRQDPGCTVLESLGQAHHPAGLLVATKPACRRRGDSSEAHAAHVAAQLRDSPTTWRRIFASRAGATGALRHRHDADLHTPHIRARANGL